MSIRLEHFAVVALVSTSACGHIGAEPQSTADWTGYSLSACDNIRTDSDGFRYCADNLMEMERDHAREQATQRSEHRSVETSPNGW